MSAQNNSDQQIIVYRPNQRHELGFFQTWKIMFLNIFRSKELIWQLFKRDFFASYKKSFLGVTWILISPVLGIISWVFLNMTGMLHPGDVGIPYPAYVLIGSSMWGLYMGFYRSASRTLSSGKSLIMQINYPHEALLFMQTAQHLANFTIALIINFIVIIAFGVIPGWKALLLPVIAIPLFLLGSGIGLLVSMISIVAVDISRVINAAMGLMMYATPLIYANNVKNPLVQTITRWNPLTYLVCSTRDIIIYGKLYDITGFLICTGISLFVFLISWRLFYISENKIIERMI